MANAPANYFNRFTFWAHAFINKCTYTCVFLLLNWLMIYLTSSKSAANLIFRMYFYSLTISLWSASCTVRSIWKDLYEVLVTLHCPALKVSRLVRQRYQVSWRSSRVSPWRVNSHTHKKKTVGVAKRLNKEICSGKWILLRAYNLKVDVHLFSEGTRRQEQLNSPLPVELKGVQHGWSLLTQVPQVNAVVG